MIIICTHNVEKKNNERSKFLHCIKQKKKCMMLVLSSICVIKETIITSCTYLLIKKIVVYKFVCGMDFVFIHNEYHHHNKQIRSSSHRQYTKGGI